MTDSILEVGYKSPTTYKEVFDQITETLKACWTLSASQRRFMVLAYATTLIIEGVSVIAPWLSSKLMAQIAGHELHFQMRDSAYVLAGIWVCWLSWGILDGIRDSFNQHFRNNLNRDLPLMAQARLLSLSRDFHQANNTGQLTAKVIRGAESITDIVDLFQHNFLPRTTVMAIVLVMLGWINIWFAITGTVLMFVYAFLIIRGRTKTQDLYDEAGDLEEKADALTSETITNVSAVQAFHQENTLLKRTHDLREMRRDLKDRERSINLATRSVRAVLADQTGWLMLFLALVLFQAQTTSFQLLVFTIGLINRFRDEIVHLGWMYEAFVERMNGIRRLSFVLEQLPTITDPIESQPLPDAELAKIAFDQVSFQYAGESAKNDGAWALQEVNIAIEAGEVLGVAGESGHGKSTLISLLLRFADPTKGCIRFNGCDLRTVALRDVRSRIGYVEQQVQLFNNTIANNIRFGRTCTQEELEAAAKIAGAHDFIVGLPDGYETLIGDRGMRLSGGQRQRLGIARAMIGKPSLLIFDEATSSIDPISIELIMVALERIKGKCTVIIVSHQLSTLQRLADRIAIVRHGRISEIGTHEQLLNHNGLYKQLVEIQQNHDRAEA